MDMDMDMVMDADKPRETLIVSQPRQRQHKP